MRRGGSFISGVGRDSRHFLAALDAVDTAFHIASTFDIGISNKSPTPLQPGGTCRTRPLSPSFQNRLRAVSRAHLE